MLKSHWNRFHGRFLAGPGWQQVGSLNEAEYLAPTTSGTGSTVTS